MVPELDHERIAFSLFTKKNAARAENLLCFAHFQAFIFQPRLQRSSPARLIFPGKIHRSAGKQHIYPATKYAGSLFLFPLFFLLGWLFHVF